MPPVIEAKNLSKKYVLTHRRQESYGSLRDALAIGVRKVASRLRHPLSASGTDRTHEDFWALKDVSFDVQSGDRVGLIGRNGAGKSTLLKILSRITEPSAGRATIRGRVASLLEVGTGFHPELTGRENIFLNGGILGMSKSDIKKRFDEIVAFAEVEKFLDTAVKHYSSGMYMRLAFAVAAHLEPEILIVDEVLAVGDAQFQKKCMGKMETVGKEGRTILFVSHNMQAVQAMCNKSIWLHGGKVERLGETKYVVNEYLNRGSGRELLSQKWEDRENSPGNDLIRLFSARVIPDTVEFDGLITINTPLRIEFVYSLSVPLESYVFAMHFLTISGDCVFITGSTHENVNPGTYKSTGYIPGDLLNAGIYTMKIYFVKDITNALFEVSDLLIFEVHDAERESGWLGAYPGAVRPKLKWDFESVVQPI